MSVLALVPLILFPSAVHAELIDRIVASVNNEVITARDLKLAVDFNEGLSGATGDRKKLEAETLEGLINRQVLLQEARRLKFVEVSDEDVRAEVQKLAQRLGSEKAMADFLAGLDATRAQVERMLGERLLAEQFLEKKVGLYIRVSRDEAQAYYDEHASAFQGKRFQEVQKDIVAILSGQKSGRQIDLYLAELRGKAEIWVNPL